MYLFNKNNDNLTWDYKTEVDKEDVEEILCILEEHLKSSKRTFGWGEDKLDPENISCVRNGNNCIYVIKKLDNFYGARKIVDKMLKSFREKDNEKYPYQKVAYEFDLNEYMVPWILTLIKKYYSIDDLLKRFQENGLAEYHPDYALAIKEYLMYQNRDTNDFDPYDIIKFYTRNINSFFKICTSINSDSKLLDEYLKCYPEIDMMRKLVPYIKLVPENFSNGNMLSKFVEITNQYDLDYGHINEIHFEIIKYKWALLNEQVIKSLNVNFKKIEVPEKPGEVITESELDDMVRIAIKDSVSLKNESNVPNVPSTYVDDNGNLQHTEQPKKLVKKPKKDKK